ncbi:class I glutamine amidotransferase [Bacteriovorax sp. BAL6_X]|uniref:aminodeoxychorismate/anthranilate synthase component II n=1 Tax=Bacteriovorax sp. BAL6_X TaxID=1201290 RepID=UPI000385D2AE|nr:aminodeoxychorismate/anthranilate synthase component II [Bacteriovorax sp. BAL6_X]EPZ50666.1 class I glutamine amidotransferase [Bacteriovorax sp. BAL6_X]
MKLVFVDFEDSFTNNILSYFNEFDFKIEVVNFRKLSHSNIAHYFNNNLVVLGPGPGHPDEYLNLFKDAGIELTDFKAELQKARRLIGICLGHQMILYLLDELKVVRSSIPMHGQAVEIEIGEGQALFDCFSEADRKVLRRAKLQRYNSLTLQISSGDYYSGKWESETQLVFDKHNELLMAYRPNRFLTMQFHPESVGTSCNNILFQAMNKFFM